MRVPALLLVLAGGVLGFHSARAQEMAPPPAPKVVHLTTKDGLTIEADWYQGAEGMPGIVGLHMYPADRTSWKPLAEARSQGYHFLAIDLRGYGGSRTQKGVDLAPRVKERDPQLFGAMWQDALAGVEFLRGEAKCDAKRIGLVGASVGCSIAIDTAVRDGRIAGVAVLTPGKNYMQVPTMDHVKSWGDTPLLLLSSEEEADGGARPIATELKAKPGVELRIVPGTKIHGTNMFGKVAGCERRIVHWFEAPLGAEILDGIADRTETTPGAVERAIGEKVEDEGAPGLFEAVRSDAGGLNFCRRFGDSAGASLPFSVVVQPGERVVDAKFTDGARRLRGKPGGDGPFLVAWLDTWKDGKWSEQPLGQLPATAISREALVEIRIPWSLFGISPGTRVRVSSFDFSDRPPPIPQLIHCVLEVPE